MAVALSLKPLSPESSCLTLPMVGVMGRDFTGTGLVSAVTVRVSALTLLAILGELVTLVIVAVQVSVTSFNSDLTLIAPGAGT